MSFTLHNRHRIDNLNLSLEHYTHPSGCRHVHLASADHNNAFLVAFLTVPEDNSGVAHILEHTSLCGSRRFPVRDPFFLMTRRSLNTFMNAFTASDWTAYPFASQNPKDFHNLLEVYLDATFFPSLNALDFAQEGHRLEWEHPGEENSALVYKGVVFNEMKGAMSAAESRLWQSVQSALFPSTTYHVNSGGEPADIPSLSHADLVAFHRSHYHPSNAVFLTYGDLPAATHQKVMEEQVLRHFQRIDTGLHIADEQRYSQPQRQYFSYAVDAGKSKAKTHVVLAWLLSKSADIRTRLEDEFIAEILLGNSACPLLHALESSDLGQAPSGLCGYEASLHEALFCCGLEGCAEQSTAAVEQLILDTLQDIANQGVPRTLQEATLHQLELAQREVGGGRFPYGLQIIMRILPAMMHGADPLPILQLDEHLEHLRQAIQDPDFIKRKLRQLLDNPHRVTVTMAPDEQLAEREQQAERDKLADIRQQLSEQEKVAIQQQADALQQRQDAEEDLSCLPKVGREDIPTNTVFTATVKTETHARLNIQHHQTGTNGLHYQHWLLPLPQLNTAERQILPLLMDLLPELGCGTRDYIQQQAHQAAVSGGINAQAHILPSRHTPQKPIQYWTLHGKALNRNQGELHSLLNSTLNTVRFDEHERIMELMQQWLARSEASLTQNGHGLAMLDAEARLSPYAQLQQQWSGLPSIRELKHNLARYNDNPATLTDTCTALAGLYQRLSQAPMEAILVDDQEAHRGHDWDWPNADTQPDNTGISLPEAGANTPQAWCTSSQVNFCAMAFPAPMQGHPDAPALTLLGPLLRNGFLHPAIREKGGAYGGGAAYAAGHGTFRFFSYRDPRLDDTLQDFNNSIDWLLRHPHSDQALEEALLNVISDIDRPQSPAGSVLRDVYARYHGLDDAFRRNFRQQITQVSLDDVKRVAAKYLQTDQASIAVVGSQEAIENSHHTFTLHPI